MSKQAPEPHDSLHVTTHLAFINKSPSNFSETVILFSIHDWEWIAWYSYRELVVEKRAQEEFDRSLHGDHRITLFDNWKSVNPHDFAPSKPRRVDEFAPKGDVGKALLLKPTINHEFLYMNLFIFGLKDGGQEHFILQMFSRTKPAELPPNSAPGVVTLAGLNLVSRLKLDPSPYEPWMGPAFK